MTTAQRIYLDNAATTPMANIQYDITPELMAYARDNGATLAVVLPTLRYAGRDAAMRADRSVLPAWRCAWACA